MSMQLSSGTVAWLLLNSSPTTVHVPENLNY